LNAELFVACVAKVAGPTTQHIVHTYTITYFESRDLFAYLFNGSSDFMPKSSGQWMHR